jgi:uncharacterized DUF497 family protein
VRFEWDRRKAGENLRKHGVSFDEASSVFDDPLGITYPDLDHSADEQRWVTFGYSSLSRLLVVSHTERDDTSRIINARPATRSEHNIYEEG